MESVERIAEDLRCSSLAEETLLLAPRSGVFYAAVQGEGVLLDLLADRYWGLDAIGSVIWQGMQERKNASCIADRLASHDLVTRIEAERLIPRQISAWREASLLVTPPVEEEGLPSAKSIGSPAVEEISDHQLGTVLPSPRQFFCLLLARFWARKAVGRLTLGVALERLQKSLRPRATVPNDHVLVLRTVRSYLALRAFLAHRNDCLSRSLCLARALQCQGVEFDLCFGVRKFPFWAHAWVEIGGVSLFDRAESLRPLTMIARF